MSFVLPQQSNWYQKFAIESKTWGIGISDIGALNRAPLVWWENLPNDYHNSMYLDWFSSLNRFLKQGFSFQYLKAVPNTKQFEFHAYLSLGCLIKKWLVIFNVTNVTFILILLIVLFRRILTEKGKFRITLFKLQWYFDELVKAHQTKNFFGERMFVALIIKLLKK